MPILLEEVEVKLDRADLLSRAPVVHRPPAPRSPGMHLSGVLRYVLTTSRMPGWRRYMSDLDADEGLLPLIWAVGIMWEEFCISLYPETIWQPGETSFGIPPVWMTCDGLIPSGECRSLWSIDEFKYTSCKRKTGVEFLRDWLKMQQGLGYCAGYGADTVRWHVLWNYQPWAPQYVRYLVRFTQAEIDGCKRMVLGNREGAEKAGYGEK